MKKILSLILALVLLGLTACTPVSAGEVISSDKQHDTSPKLDKDDLSLQVGGNNAFAFNLYKSLKEEDGNIFYSPHSISLALAITYAGARGETEQQMADTMKYLLSQDRLHPALNGLDIELSERGKGAEGKDAEGFRLNIVNAIWGQKDYTFLDKYLDVLAENYGAGLRTLDYINAPEESRITINDWVSKQTEGRIEDLIPQGVINTLTRLVLTNAIYFNAAWEYPFEEEATRDDTFNLINGDKITVPMMYQTKSFGYKKGNGFQAVEIPYDGRELSMVVLLPEEGNFENFENLLIDAFTIDSIIRDMEYRQVSLSMPKFEYESEFSLKKTLAAMGMPVAFSDAADFSGMTGSCDLFIAEVIHKAFVSVDEAGTEAAAATAVVMQLTAMPEEPVQVTIDRPFIFLIRDIETGAIMFIGRVMEPGV